MTLQAQGTFVQYWGLFIALYLAVAGQSNLIALFFTGKSRSVMAGAMLVILWAMGGLQLTYQQIMHTLSYFGAILNYISPFKWSSELQVNAMPCLAIPSHFM